MIDQKGPVCLKAAGLAGAAVGDNAPAAVLVHRGRVAALGRQALEAGAPVRELEGLWLSPAPLDAHVHLYLNGGLAPSPATTPAETVALNLERHRRAGVVAVRDLGHRPSLPSPVESDPPPLVRGSGPGLGPTGPAACWLADQLAGPPAFAAMAEERAQQGAHWVKIFATGLLDFSAVGRVNHPRAVAPDELRAAVEAAARRGLPVSVHGSAPDCARAVAAAGVRSLEHGFFLGEADLALLAEKGVAWIPTIAAVQGHVDDPQGRHDPQTIEVLKEIVRLQRSALALGHRLGVELVLGTDAGSYGMLHGRAVFDEMRQWLAAGLPPDEIFRAATRSSAHLMGLDDQLGGIFVGARAWLLATPGDPQNDPLLLEKPAWSSLGR